jgi:membrane-bound lytic murein transglycosylase A
MDQGWGAGIENGVRLTVCVVLLAITAACAGGPRTGGIDTVVPLTGLRDPSQYVPAERINADFRSLDGWGRDNHALVLPALRKTCAWIAQQPPSKPIGGDGQAGTMGDWQRACTGVARLSDGDMEAARKFLEATFRPQPLGNGDDGLFTGYYEPTLHGSWTKTGKYTVPLYRKPPGGKALPARARIAAGALAGRGLELMWVDNAVDAFFLEIQGSGRAIMTDGSVVGLGFAGQNGQEYFPIGRHLIDEGYATKEQMSMPFIRQWLSDHPADAQKVMNLNPSYVFFKQRDGAPRGARNMELTAGRSLAVDTEHVPIGVPLWIDLTEAPVEGGRIQRLVMAQDTGGAIKGAVRGDLFWGADENAAAAAGVMKARGRYAMLVPRERTVFTANR